MKTNYPTKNGKPCAAYDTEAEAIAAWYAAGKPGDGNAQVRTAMTPTGKYVVVIINTVTSHVSYLN